MRHEPVYKLGLHGPVLAAAVLISGLIGTIAAAAAVSQALTGGDDGATMIALCVVFAVLFVLWLILTFRAVFYPDRLVKGTIFGNREILRREIRGYRLINNDNGLRIELIDGDKPVQLPASVLKRAEVQAWFEGLTDLNAEDMAASEKRFAENAAYGPDPQTRLKRLAFWRTVLKWLYWPSFGVFIWVMIIPEPYLWAVGTTAAIPVLGLLMEAVSGGIVCFGGDDNTKDVRPPAAWFLTMPVFALGLRLYHDCNLLDWAALFQWSVVFGAATAAYVAIRSQEVREKVSGIAYVFVFASAYWAGVMGIADVMFDDGPQKTFPVTIAALEKSDSKYYATVGPWGPVAESSRIEVMRDFHDRHRKGDRVCVYQGGGRIGFAWYDLGDC